MAVAVQKSAVAQRSRLSGGWPYELRLQSGGISLGTKLTTTATPTPMTVSIVRKIASDHG
jgi:hypothetical protein